MLHQSFVNKYNTTPFVLTNKILPPHTCKYFIPYLCPCNLLKIEIHFQLSIIMAKLYLIPTPVGNLEDITLRALRILKEVPLVLAEDTRTSAKLLKHYEINTPLLSHHKFNEHQQVSRIAERIARGEDIALISDAGTPGISDPGFLLVRTCIEQGIETECLPGATAFVPALVNSGYPVIVFVLRDFYHKKKAAKRNS